MRGAPVTYIGRPGGKMHIEVGISVLSRRSQTACGISIEWSDDDFRYTWPTRSAATCKNCLKAKAG